MVISPDSFCYVLYTSGSTGQPKGVVDTHRNVLHNVMTHTNDLHISALDRLSFLYSFSFAAAVHNAFGALLNGASLVPYDPRSRDISELAGCMIREEITIYDSVGTLFRQFVSTLSGEEGFPALRVVRLGSEPIYRSDVDAFRRHFPPDCILANSMGTTEASLIRLFLLDKDTPVIGSNLPVGYEVEDQEVILLDENCREVGAGCVGEIAVSSPYLSPGYWRRPDLTAAAFFPDPRGGGRRIYRTGDLGRISEDGCLEHLGRKDFRTKIKGYSVELGEIEAALLSHPSVKEAVVIAEEGNSGGAKLVAYVVPKSKGDALSELRRSLAATLPDYMLPASFVALDSLPLTRTGKVDRAALSKLPRSRPVVDSPFVAPRTAVEKQLVKIWEEILGVNPVGVDDDFLSLGGDSLAASRVVVRIRNLFGIDMPVRAVFAAPTIAQMAEALVNRSAESLGSGLLSRLLAEVEQLGEKEAESHLRTVK